MKFPTIKEMAEEVAEKALDEYEYKGKTLRKWIEIIRATDNNVATKDGTNLAEVGTDCISRQQALEAFGLSEKTRKYGGDHSGYDTMMMYEIQDIIENLPPIQPDIVRCKDCKYWNSGSCEYPEHVVNCQDYYVGDIETEAEHFCGYADRRDDE